MSYNMFLGGDVMVIYRGKVEENREGGDSCTAQCLLLKGSDVIWREEG